MRRPLVIGNWKMNGDGSWLERVDAIARVAEQVPEVEIGLCVPATLIHRAASIAPELSIGAQDCHEFAAGPYTGSLAATMLREAGARLVIVGHSERRAACGSGDEDAAIADKVASAQHARLCPVLCVGETAEQRAGGDAICAVREQLAASLPATSDESLIVAYEPIWAIGRGAPPKSDEIAPIVSALRAAVRDRGLQGARLLYGGSVDASSVHDLMRSTAVDGLLVGKASMDPSEMRRIVLAVQQAVRR